MDPKMINPGSGSEFSDHSGSRLIPSLDPTL
jgi:hypothetical protein